MEMVERGAGKSNRLPSNFPGIHARRLTVSFVPPFKRRIPLRLLALNGEETIGGGQERGRIAWKGTK